MSHIKDINLFESIERELKDMDDKNGHWMKMTKPEEILDEEVTIKIVINNNMDICARVKSTSNEPIFLKKQEDTRL